MKHQPCEAGCTGCQLASKVMLWPLGSMEQAAFALHKSGTATFFQALLPAALGYCLRALICGLQLTRELDDAKAAFDKADAEITGLQAALESVRARHFDHLSR